MAPPGSCMSFTSPNKKMTSASSLRLIPPPSTMPYPSASPGCKLHPAKFTFGTVTVHGIGSEPFWCSRLTASRQHQRRLTQIHLPTLRNQGTIKHIDHAVGRRDIPVGHQNPVDEHTAVGRRNRQL